MSMHDANKNIFLQSMLADIQSIANEKAKIKMKHRFYY